MKYLTTLFLALVSLSMCAQNIYVYTYDDAGNRIQRDMIPLRLGGPEGSSAMEQRFGQFKDFEDTSPDEGHIMALDSMEISFYPNPARRRVQVAFSTSEVATQEVRIVSDNGQILYQRQNLWGNFELPFERLAPGTYFIWLKLDGRIVRQMVIKE